ncbi:hypothetical protein BDR26DRAFT_876740 [Obelidium mucronatum]|nr:hypothetical protein BDR26DRAFT_876740 [Obelidium mucronatum]
MQQHAKPNLQTLPKEILDMIIPYLPGLSLVRICHTVPKLKYISKILHDAGTELNTSINDLYPEFWLPCNYMDAPSTRKQRLPQPGPLPITNPTALAPLAKLLNLYNGVAKVQADTVEYAMQIIPYLPKIIDIYYAPGAWDMYLEYTGTDSYLSILQTFRKEYKGKIRTIDIPCVFEGNEHWDNSDFLDAIKDVSHLRCFNFGGPNDSMITLLEFTQLIQVEFCGDDGFGGYSDPIDGLFKTVVSKHTTLRSVIFERATADVRFEGSDIFLGNARSYSMQLEQIAWTCLDGIGSVYGNDCVIWQKVGLPLNIQIEQ